MRRTQRIILTAAILLLLCITPVFGDQVVANSERWQDVYSSILYAIFSGKEYSFLVSDRHAPIMLNSIGKNTKIEVVSSKKAPFFIGYENLIESRGYPDAQEFEFDNVNLELAKRLTNINNFIIIDDSYGYNAVSVAPYAVKKNSYVLMADRTNIDEVESFLSEKTLGELIIYGHVDREVKEALAPYNPITVGTGDRFEDNIEIVKRYRTMSPVKQVIMSNGEFIEKEIMSGVEPVLFIGKQNVPDIIKEYIKATDIEVAVLIGNELVGTATNIRRDIGISTFVKFAQGARTPAGGISAVEGLDLFYLPTYSLNLQITSVKYNRATGNLEVTYRNNADVATYFKGTITVSSDTGETKRVGDVESVFIEANDYKTMVYPDMGMTGEKLTAKVFTIYGESKRSLEYAIDATLEVSIIDIIDRCEILIKQAIYHRSKELFMIQIESTEDVDCYVDLELTDVLVADERVTLGLTGVEKFSPKETRKLEIPAELTDYDIDKNRFIDITAYYGQRQDSLTKILKGKFELILKKYDMVFYAAVAVVAVLIFLLLFFLLKRRKKDYEE